MKRILTEAMFILIGLGLLGCFIFFARHLHEPIPDESIDEYINGGPLLPRMNDATKNLNTGTHR